MHELYRVAQLVRYVARLVHGIRVVAVVFLESIVDFRLIVTEQYHEVEHAESEQIEHQAHVTVVVEVIQQLDDEVTAMRVVLHQLLQDVDFQPGCLAVLGNVLDDLQRQLAVPPLFVLNMFEKLISFVAA